MPPERTAFIRALRRHGRAWRGGRLLGAGLRLARVALLWGLLGAGLDYYLALSSNALLLLDTVGGGVLVFYALWLAIGALGITPREIATRADALHGSPRQPVLTALELDSTASAREDWQEFLVAQSWREAAAVLDSIRTPFPWAMCRRQAGWLLAVLVLGTLVFLAQPQALRVVLNRLAHPQQDLPPYSPYHFTITPQPARVLYGSALELQVQIEGAPVRQTVMLHTRRGEAADAMACLRQNETRFAQRLDKVTDPVEFCFSVGRARSPWQPVEIMLQPKAALVKIVIEPPTYTGLAATESILAQDRFEGYPGSKVRLQVTSNRPLSQGEVILVPAVGNDPPQTVAATKVGQATVEFVWEIKRPCRLEVQIADVQGGRMAEPLRLVQKVLADKPPEVTLSQPPPYVLATPSAKLAIEGGAADDLGLAQIALVRAVAGYRDRSLPVGNPAGEKRFTVQRSLDLAALGVIPGQVLEVFLEARDYNPDLTGYGASEVARVEIVSEAEYAETLRARETLNQFAERYRLVNQEVEAFRKTIAELLEENQRPGADPARLNALLDQARAQNERTQQFFERLASEVPAFALETNWNQALSELAKQFARHGSLLAGQKAGSTQLKDILERLKKDLSLAPLAKPNQMTAEFLEVGRVMEQTTAFLQILNRQREVARRFERFLSEPNSGQLIEYGRRQSAIHDDFLAWVEALRQAANALAPEGEYAELRQSALQFADQAAECGASEGMRQAAGGAQQGNHAEAARQARLAKEKLEELLTRSGNSPCAGMCQNKLSFQVSEDLRESLSQLLRALMNRNGQGQGMGLGVGGGVGDAQDGYSVPSHSRLNTPMIGPPRSVFMPGGHGVGDRGPGGQGAGGHEAASNPDSPIGMGAKDRSRQGPAPELVPEKYREAVKRYFNPKEPAP